MSASRFCAPRFRGEPDGEVSALLFAVGRWKDLAFEELQRSARPQIVHPSPERCMAHVKSLQDLGEVRKPLFRGGHRLAGCCAIGLWRPRGLCVDNSSLCRRGYLGPRWLLSHVETLPANGSLPTPSTGLVHGHKIEKSRIVGDDRVISTAQERGDTRAILVLGAGQAGFQVAASLRDFGYRGCVTLVGDEPHWPYRRPPLSKGYLEGSDSAGTLALRLGANQESLELVMRLGKKGLAIDRSSNIVTLDSGERIGYDHLVIAMGATPRALRVPGVHLEGVLSLRTVEHAEALRNLFREPGDMVVIGGGFIGMEVAAVAAKAGQRVTVVEAEDRVMSRVVAPEISGYVASEHAAHGVSIMTGRCAVAFHGRSGRVSAVELDDGVRLPARIVLVGVGVSPNIALAEEAALTVDNGIVVDGSLLTSDERISAIGDCSSFPSVHARRRVRLESVQNAVDQAKYVAGRLTGMMGEVYQGTPCFWTRQYSTSIQIAGIGDGNDERWVSGDPASGKFSIFRFNGGTLSCVESVNSSADHAAVRKLFSGGMPLPTPRELTDAQFLPKLSLERVAAAESS